MRAPREPAPQAPLIAPDLVYVQDTIPGIQRRLRRGKFVYTAPDGERVRDEATLARINRLAIPPAYRDVWICPDPRGHVQATAKDARGRKQYRYHPRWNEIRDAQKYDRLSSFARALPRIRKAIDLHLAEPGLGHAKVMATVVCLLERTLTLDLYRGDKRRTAKALGVSLKTIYNRLNKYSGGVPHQNAPTPRQPLSTLAANPLQCAPVPGCRPVAPTGSVAEWSIALVLKTSNGQPFVSSNLTASAKFLSMVQREPPGNTIKTRQKANTLSRRFP